MNSEVEFFGERLRLARILKGSTQQELGDEIAVTRQYVHQLESGARHPADDVLHAIYEVLHVQPNFFRSPVGNDVKFEQCHFRKRKTTPVGVANRVLAFSTIFEQLVSFANEHLELPSANFPSVKHVADQYTNAEIEAAASDCRKLWGLEDKPISNVTRALENAGVIITHFSGLSEKVDALSLNRRHPIIVRNDAKESVCRMRFDLGHECGHFVLHDGVETGDSVTESEADRFASAFLFPREAFLREFPNYKGRRLEWSIIYRLKIRWGVSARALIYKAHHHDLITAQQYRGANVYLNKTGQSKRERYDDQISLEKPELLKDIFDILREQLGMSFQYVADTLSIDPHMLSLITGVSSKGEVGLENVVPIGKAKTK